MRHLAQFISILGLAVGGCGPSGEPAPEAGEAAWTDPAPHRAGFATGNGARIHYLDWGGSGHPLVLVHGYGDNAHIWDDLVSALGDGFRVVAYTRRGHGRSESAEPYDMDTLVEDLRHLLDTLGIPRAHLVGWSMGGNEITLLAQKYPDRVGRIAYFDAGYDWADPRFVAALDSFPGDPAVPESARASLDAFREWQIRTWFPSLTGTERLEAYVRDQVTAAAGGTVRPAMSDSVFQALYLTLVTSRRDYTGVSAPALAIYSETFLDLNHPDSAARAMSRPWEERYFAPFRTASVERIRRELPQVEVVRVPGTHADFPFTSRERIVEVLRGFLAEGR